MTDPTVTTILPTFRRPRLLKRAIESFIGQTYRHSQLYVCDNASGDATERVVRAYAAVDPRINYHCHGSNIGLGRNLAFGLDRVTTQYFSVLSDDDWLLPDFYRMAVRALESRPDAAFVSTRVIHVDDDARVVRTDDITCGRGGVFPSPDRLVALLEQGIPIWTGTLFRTSMVSAIGGLDSETGTVGDVDLFCRLAAQHPFMVEPKPGAVFSRRRNSISGQVRLSSTWPGWLKMMENVSHHESISHGAGEHVEYILVRQLVTRLYGIGLVSSRLGNFDDAIQAAGLLAGRYRQQRKADAIRLFVFMFRHFPLLRRIVPRVGKGHLDYLRLGWRNTPIRIDAYLAQLGTS